MKYITLCTIYVVHQHTKFSNTIMPKSVDLE